MPRCLAPRPVRRALLSDRVCAPTFDALVGRGAVPAPRGVSVPGKVTQFEVRDSQPDDGRLIELRCNGCRKRQHLGQFVELEVLLPST